ncbi:MAG: DNA starvation/stationary phase protection protein [Alphaproteobacteria bacterium]|jgi:starvation-inducible DNA-binding protein|nr:DNA starvation/stationary phase protection protein [Alphaproteobacteria bacterium]
MATADVLKPHATVDEVETGLGKDARENLAVGLSALVADSYMLLVKTQGFHWNVVGPLFRTLHKMTEDQYRELFEGADEIAERIRMLGYPAPGSFAQMSSMSAIKERTDNTPSAEEMVSELIADHETLVRRMREVAVAADELSDTVTNDLLTERMAAHEKTIWMMKATIAQ